MEDFISIKDNLITKKAELNLLTEQLKEELKKERFFKNKVEDAKMARSILQEAAKKTQQNLEFHISHLITLSLKAVFVDPPEFIMSFETRRNKTECDLFFKQDGELYDPIDDRGGGICDVTSFALRIAFWSIKKNRNTMILDEPFKNASPTLHEKISEMLNLISDRLNLQIIMVSHSNDINICADKVLICEKKGRKSKLRELGK